MNCHQILSGACNAGDRCFAVGSVEGIPFTAYAAGCNIVILASSFERVQIIPGAIHGYIKISALDCSTDTGKIAAAYENKICIFEPTPVLQNEKHCTHYLDYRWVQTASFTSHAFVITLSWNLEGTRLLTGGAVLQLWKEKTIPHSNEENFGVKFVIGGDKENKLSTDEGHEEEVSWENIWSCKTAIPIYLMAFSPDGTLFATCGQNDRLVKIWYENKQILFSSKLKGINSSEDGDLNFTYVYIAHPRAVSNIIWRKTSKYMPKASVSNMLVTSCLDNICRIWIETILPDDGLVNIKHFDPLASQNPKFRTHRHKHRFMQRLKHMKTCFHIRKHVKINAAECNNTAVNVMYKNYNGPIPSLPSTCSVHDFHSFGFHGTGITQGMHFHLAASINAETDIPLVPSMKTRCDSSDQNYFILHWLNNKEMDFTLQAESILQELTRKVIDEENGNTATHNSTTQHTDSFADLNSARKKYIRTTSKSIFTDDSSIEYDEANMNVKNIQNSNPFSNTTSLNSLHNEHSPTVHQLNDSLDIKIDCLLRNWHQSPDLLFAIHPVDGSFLIWVIEWLDDFYPGSFRQAQVSFSTRIPSAFPLGDSMSMSTTVSLYNTGTHPLTLREIANNVKIKDLEEELLQEDANSSEGEVDPVKKSKSANEEEGNKEEAKNSSDLNISSCVPPIVSMVTKHTNGTLNLWQVSFAYSTRFTQILSIGHVSRVSGHRFRINDITCHPVLPLLVSTSHHNISEATSDCDKKPAESLNINNNVFAPSGFCSELILWRVDSVGPLCHTGGVSELARINSPEISAFSNVAWIPTLLPSTTLGSYSNSPSACFVASDGENLRVYQAVIDARTLLAEISECSETASNLRKCTSETSLYSNASSSARLKKMYYDKLKVVSQQSTSRPGCIIQLNAISDGKHDWQNTQFLHVFQAQLINGSNVSTQTDSDAILDLHRNIKYEEVFYSVIIEKTLKGSTIHMWRIVISSKQQATFLSDTAMYVPDSNLTQDIQDYEAAAGAHGDLDKMENTTEAPHISIVTEKVCTQELPLPDGVDVVHASPAAGHLSSSSIYPACYAPYLIVTACTDSIVRFWKCEKISPSTSSSYKWVEWKMFNRKQNSSIDISGQPLNISAAYSGRIACAYKYGKSFTRPSKGGDPELRYINLCVAIYECESTGGSEWILEDTIHLKNINLPRSSFDHDIIDLSFLHDNRVLQKKQRLNQVLHTFTSHDDRLPCGGDNQSSEHSGKSSPGLLAIPSFSTLQSLKRSITENGNTYQLTQKHLVQLDWVSKEDGSHILTVAAGSKILLYTAVSSDIAQANVKAMKESRSINRPILSKTSSLAQPHFNDEIRWMKLRQIALRTADGLPPLPMQISWVRDGILVVAMDSEMHVYSQWKSRYLRQSKNVENYFDNRDLRDEDLRSIANDSTKFNLKSVSLPFMNNKFSTVNLSRIYGEKKKKLGNSYSEHFQSGLDPPGKANDDYLTDFGLFQASRIACPVLPQYHPKQLMELLNCGKIQWVKAILAHLVRCLSGPNLTGVNECDDASVKQRSWSRSRTLSISCPVDQSNITFESRGSTAQVLNTFLFHTHHREVAEELMLDYAEITSIPSLPLWVLLNADKETSINVGNLLDEENDYGQLFDINASDENLDDFLHKDNAAERNRSERRQSLHEKHLISHFGPRQGQQLSRLLTHTHLPGLSSLDQMHLLALADTVSTCNKDISEKFISETGKYSSTKESSGNSMTDSLDYCGLRFLLAMKHYIYLLRCLPLNQRSLFQKHGIGTDNIVWAFHSESEEELINLIPSYQKGDLKWSTLKDLGVGYWLRSLNVLRRCAEKLAKCAYQSKQDPLDAAIYYLAMKKKSLVWGLFRSKRDEKMTKFFSNNFAEDRWRKAALKNAFVLLGKQRFEHAVSFFLLANSLNDAIEVCIDKLDDFQLALIIARLYESDLDTTSNSSVYKKLLCQHILGIKHERDTFDPSSAHPDPFLRSMTYWILQEYQNSLNALLLTNDVGQNHSAFNEVELCKQENQATNPNVFNFYIYLRTHPLLIRQNLALSVQEKKVYVLAGFSHMGRKYPVNEPSAKQFLLEDSITSVERQLYFTTAHGHFKAGCPVLALEVLNKLPLKILDFNDMQYVEGRNKLKEDNNLINTGVMDWESTPLTKNNSSNAATDNFDWSTPECLLKKGDDDFQIKWDDDEPEEESSETETNNMNTKEDDSPSGNIVDEGKTKDNVIDIMAQQLKFVACLKILMEELSTLATGFEVDGGQLRYQLYIWLEKEVEALKYLCNYCNADLTSDYTSDSQNKEADEQNSQFALSEKPTLHEILMQEKKDFEGKVMRAAKRKKWLKENETLLRTLLSYCSLHGASGGGLASVRMELVLLLQELQQEKTQQQLLSPLPFPTTLPLLSACVAGNKTVIADPIKYLQSQTIDMLQTIINFSPFNGLEKNSFCEIFIMRDLAVALSSCIYQSLCDSESFVLTDESENVYYSPGIENIAKLYSSFECSHLIGNTNIYNKKRKNSIDQSTVCTSPSKWPGVANLRALLAQEKDEDIPKLNILLLESFIAVYIALAVYALMTCDSRILYRLVAHRFSIESWSCIFGGGTKKLLRNPTSETKRPKTSTTTTLSEETIDENNVWNTVSSITKQRVKLNMRLLGNFGTSSTSLQMKEDKPTYREQFLPPQMSMLSYFLIKPTTTECDDYDTDDDPIESEEEEEVDDEIFHGKQVNKMKENVEHSDPLSYSWSILRLALIKMFIKNVHDFMNVSGIEIQDLPVLSPMAHEVIRTLNRWQDIALKILSVRSPPEENYIPGCFTSNGFPVLSIHKHRLMLNKENTPFVAGSSSAQIRRLWNYLIRQEHVQDVFTKIIFAKRPEHNSTQGDFHNTMNTGNNATNENRDPVRIIHKDNETVTAFCLNNSSNIIAIANPREIQELDISLLLESPNWYEDECDYDMLNVSRESEMSSHTGFLVVQTPEQSQHGNSLPTEFSSNCHLQSGRGTDLILKHKIDNVKRMSAHPLMPLYLTGGQDGSVQMWEWGHQQIVCMPRTSATFAKVTRCRFSEQGNKFGIGDGDGNLSLWQAGIASQSNKSFYTHQCHTKTLSDFIFLGSCSLLATAGQSPENKNIAIWDTLLSQKKSCVTAFTCHDQGASCFVFAPQHQLLLSCGKKGDICIIDIRQRILKHRFQAHDTAIKCIGLDPHEEFFATGSLEGDIKIWSLHQYVLITTYPSEHTKNSFFKHIGQGVSQIHIDACGRLFSCGSDGCIKVRQLFEKDSIVSSIY